MALVKQNILKECCTRVFTSLYLLIYSTFGVKSQKLLLFFCYIASKPSPGEKM